MSAYESVTAWRQKRKNLQRKYEANMANAVSALQTAWTDVGYNVGEIAANRAVKRLQEAAKAKQAKLQSERERQANTIQVPKQSVYASSSTSTLEGGSRIDLSSSTLTLSNGTVIDLKTGVKKVDVTV